MLDLVEIIAAIGELFASWRFCLCCGNAAGLIALVYWWMPDPWRLMISIPIAVIAATIWILWERRGW